jgi:hypothetical protein
MKLIPKATNLFVLCVFLMISCTNNKKAHETKTFPVEPMIILSGDEYGWGKDIQLSIVEKTITDSADVYKVVSSYKNKNLGLLILVPKRKVQKSGFGHGMLLKSTGAESDYLLEILANLYQDKNTKAFKFIDSINVSYVDLDEFVKGMSDAQEESESKNKKYKLFFEGKDGDYAELYLNINEDEKWIQIGEKDEEYRSTIIKFLSKKIF